MYSRADFFFFLAGSLTHFLMMLTEANPYFSWSTKIIQVPLVVAVRMVELIRCMLLALHYQIFECTDATMLSHSNYSLVM
jgi:hypothetical protein